MAEHRLKLTRYGIDNVRYKHLGAFRIRIEATDPTDSGMDTNVFVYRQDPINAYSGDANNTFMAVASAVDLAEYPADEPNTATEFPFFRLNYVELDVRAISQAEEFWQIVVHDVGVLIESLNVLIELREQEAVWVGAPFGNSGNSDSTSSSESV